MTKRSHHLLLDLQKQFKTLFLVGFQNNNTLNLIHFRIEMLAGLQQIIRYLFLLHRLYILKIFRSYPQKQLTHQKLTLHLETPQNFPHDLNLKTICQINLSKLNTEKLRLIPIFRTMDRSFNNLEFLKIMDKIQ